MNIKEQFEADTKGHIMTIEHDDGVFRSLCFAKPDTICQSFKIVTYPGGLTYTGDMGHFMFRRLRDMFDFFRGDGINPSYWAEKCVAGRVKEMSTGSIVDAITAAVDEFCDGHDVGRNERNELRERLFEAAPTDSADAFVAWAQSVSEDVETPKGYAEFTMEDAWEHDLEDYTHRFLWCLHAIVWGIGVYDAEKEEE